MVTSLCAAVTNAANKSDPGGVRRAEADEHHISFARGMQWSSLERARVMSGHVVRSRSPRRQCAPVSSSVVPPYVDDDRSSTLVKEKRKETARTPPRVPDPRRVLDVPRPFEVLTVAGDGSCLYHAVEAAVAGATQNRDRGHALRERLGQYAQRNRRRLSELLGRQLVDAVIARTSDFFAWAENEEVLMLSKMFGCCIVVHTRDCQRPVRHIYVDGLDYSGRAADAGGAVLASSLQGDAGSLAAKRPHRKHRMQMLHILNRNGVHYAPIVRRRSEA